MNPYEVEQLYAKRTATLGHTYTTGVHRSPWQAGRQYKWIVVTPIGVFRFTSRKQAVEFWEWGKPWEFEPSILE